MGKSSVQVGIEKKERTKHMSKERYQAYCAFWDLLEKAIKNKDTSFSIIETQIALGLYERKE